MTAIAEHGVRFTLALASSILAPGIATTAQAQAPIRIGASPSLAGSFAALGQNQHRGYQFCVKPANEKGGVLGRKLELVVEDDKSEGATAARIYEKLIVQDNGVTVGGALPKFYETLGRDAESVYGASQWLPELVTLRAGSLDGEAVRAAILKLDYDNAYGAFKVDEDGFRTAHRMVLSQWQDGKKVIVWPE